MKYFVFALLGMAMFCSGCTVQQYSKNMQVSSVRGASMFGTTATLDETSIDDYDANKAIILKAVEDIRKFLDTGAIKDLPIRDLAAQLKGYMVAKGYAPAVSTAIIDGVVAYLGNVQLNTELVDEYVKFLILQSLDEVERTAKLHKKDWRRPNPDDLMGPRHDATPDAIVVPEAIVIEGPELIEE